MPFYRLKQIRSWSARQGWAIAREKEKQEGGGVEREKSKKKKEGTWKVLSCNCSKSCEGHSLYCDVIFISPTMSAVRFGWYFLPYFPPLQVCCAYASKGSGYVKETRKGRQAGS